MEEVTRLGVLNNFLWLSNRKSNVQCNAASRSCQSGMDTVTTRLMDRLVCGWITEQGYRGVTSPGRSKGMSANVRYFAFTKWAKRHCSSCGWRYYNVNCGELSHVPQREREIYKELQTNLTRRHLEWKTQLLYREFSFSKILETALDSKISGRNWIWSCTRSRRLVSNALQLLNRQRVLLSVQRRDQRVISNEIKQNEIVCHFSIRGLGTAKRHSL